MNIAICLAASVAVGLGAPDASPPQSDVPTFTENVVQSTTAEWTALFAAAGRDYRAPRIVITDPPRGHPSSGSGYANGLLVLDGREIEDILSLAGRDGEALAALVIAHEVAHHVQYLNRVSSVGVTRELQADCAAGWWLNAANVRELRARGQTRYQISDIEHQLPRLIGALETLNGHIDIRGMPSQPIGHGNLRERVHAFSAGMDTNLSACGAGVTP